MDSVEGKIDRREFLKKALLGTGLALVGTDLINQAFSDLSATHIAPEVVDCDRGLCDRYGACCSGICVSGFCKPTGKLS